ncbi:Uncharacterized protein PCOAH_00043270 [Plasmodium coatneyi]|uniref:Uncharacterized protein n=1 Tax=Plasmodium coatneyi TaxID=208452 RepID=A0A1B1E3C6_9APIC|nr:Uncharacterized protein PCOAH_00043270 [Plasmodium coatneyi]ANQ09450.1 Uncharacterized protein PCOAH_00043270 [Plasmodium coatneyi]
MDEAKQPSELCSGGQMGEQSGVPSNDRRGGFNFDFSYESILNNDIVRPQEIDCGMSCASSFFEGSDRVALGGDYATESSGDPAVQQKCENSAPPRSTRSTSALDFSFQRDPDEGGSLWGGQKRGASNHTGGDNIRGDNIHGDNTRYDDAVSANVGEVHGEERSEPQCVDHLIGYEDLLTSEAPKGEGHLLVGTNNAQNCDAFKEKKEENTRNELAPDEERSQVGASTTNSGGTCIITPSITTTEKQGKSYKSSPSISSTRASDVSEANEIYRSLQTEIAAYKLEVFRLKSEVQVKNSYLQNERKKNEEYGKILERFLLEPSSSSKRGDECMGSLNLLEVENKKLRQELALKSSETIELNNLVNNLKSEKVIFMHSLQNELEVCMSKEAESSLMLHAQTKRLTNANNYITKQNKQIAQLKEELNKLEETYVLHVHKMEHQINQLVEERNEFISTAKRLEVINLENKKKDEELSKYKQKCKELTEELNDFLRIVSTERENKGGNFGGFYQDGNSISSFTSLKEGFLEGGSHLKEENSILARKIKQLMEQNDALQMEVTQRVNDLKEVTNQLESHKQTIKVKSENHALLLERYNNLEKDFENVHLLCMQLEERFRIEQSNHTHANGNIISNASGNGDHLLGKSNFSLSELELNHSQQSEINIQHYKIFCSELQLENESLKQTVQRLKSKNRKLTTSMELLLRDLVAAGGGPPTEMHDKVETKVQAVPRSSTPEGATEEGGPLITNQEETPHRSINHLSGKSNGENPPPRGGQKSGYTQTEKHPMEETTEQGTQTMEGRTPPSEEKKKNEYTQTEGQGESLGEDPPGRHLISEGVNTEEKISTSKQVYTHENRSFVNSGTNTNLVDVTHVGINPNVIDVTDVGVNPNRIDSVDQGTTPEEETKRSKHREAQTEEVNLLVRFTQTEDPGTVNREVLTDLHGINSCSVKRIMLACSSSKNKKVQVTTTTMNAFAQTVETSKHGNHYNCGAYRDVLYDGKRDKSTTRRIKKRQHVKVCSNSPFYSDEESTGEGGDVSYESYTTSSTSENARFRCTEKRGEKKNYVPTCRGKQNNGKYPIRRRFKGDNLYLHGGDHANNRRRRKTNYKYMNPSSSYSLSRGRKDDLQRGTDRRIHKKNEIDEVESLIEILKYSSDNYESDMDGYDGYDGYDDLDFCRNPESYDHLPSDYSRIRSKRLSNQQKRHSHRTHKQLRDVSEGDYTEGVYPHHDKTPPRRRNRKIRNSLLCRGCHPQRVIIKENKYIQTGEYFLESEFNYDPNVTPMGSPPHCNTKKNITTLRRKIKEYLNDYYETVIICEHCKGVYVDVSIVHLVREYISQITFCHRCGGGASKWWDASLGKSDYFSGDCSSRGGANSAAKQKVDQRADDATNLNGDPPTGTLESFLIKRIPLKLPICTCTLVNLKYKKVLMRKEESAVGASSTRLTNQPTKRKKKKQSEKHPPKKELLNKALDIIGHMRGELHRIKCVICSFLLLNERNELHRIILTSARLTEVFPFILRKYAPGGSECCDVVASSEGLLRSQTKLSHSEMVTRGASNDPVHLIQENSSEHASVYRTRTYGSIPHCASNNGSSNVTVVNPFSDSIFASTTDGRRSFADASTSQYAGGNTEQEDGTTVRSTLLLDAQRIANHGSMENSSYLYSPEKSVNQVNQVNHNELCSEVATNKPHDVVNHSGNVSHLDNSVHHDGKENVTLFAILSVLRLHELHVLHNLKGVMTSNRIGVAAEGSDKLGSSLPPRGNPAGNFIPPGGVDSFFESYRVQHLGEGIVNADERTSLTLIMRDIVKNVEQKWKSIASVYLHLDEPISEVPIQMADVLRMIQNYEKVDLYMKRLSLKRGEDQVDGDIQLREEGKYCNGRQSLKDDALILRLKAEIEQLAKEKEAMNKTLREAVDENARYSKLCAHLQEGNPLQGGDASMGMNKIDSCISRIEELHAEIEVLKQRGGNDRIVNYSSGGSDVCSEGCPNGDAQEDDHGDDDDDGDDDWDDHSDDAYAYQVKKKKKKTRPSNSLQGPQINIIYNVIIILRNSITHLVTYVHRKISNSAKLNVNHIRQLYTNVVNVLLDLPKELNLTVVFIRKREINFQMYLKKRSLTLEPTERQLPSRDSDHAVHDSSDGSSLEDKVTQQRRKKKKKKKKIMNSQMYTLSQLSECHVEDETAIASSQKKRKGRKKKVVEGTHCLVGLADVSDQDSSSDVSLLFDL